MKKKTLAKEGEEIARRFSGEKRGKASRVYHAETPTNAVGEKGRIKVKEKKQGRERRRKKNASLRLPLLKKKVYRKAQSKEARRRKKRTRDLEEREES